MHGTMQCSNMSQKTAKEKKSFMHIFTRCKSWSVKKIEALFDSTNSAIVMQTFLADMLTQAENPKSEDTMWSKNCGEIEI